MAGVPSGGNAFKNIAIGVVTTVVAYLIVHFIFDKKDKHKEEKAKKEKIEAAWNSVNEYLNNMGEKLTTISCYSCDPVEMKNEILRELDQMNGSLRNIKESGEMDDKMKSLIDRTIQQFADEKPVLAVFYDSMNVLKNFPVDEQTVVGARLQKTMLEKLTHIQTRDSVEFTRYLADINKKYKTNLAMKEPELQFDPVYLPGKWRVECSYYIYLYRNEECRFSKDETDIKGKWKLNNRDLVLTLNNGEELTYTIIELGPKLMLLNLSLTGITYGACSQ